MIFLLFIAVFPAALLIAAFTDLSTFKIPNWVSGLMAIGFFPAALSTGVAFGPMIENIFVGLGALVLGFILFARNIIGGGDAKLLAATALWFGLTGLSALLLNVALAGGCLALTLIVFRKTPALPVYAQVPWLLRLHQKPKDIPYAVAIAAGGLLSIQETLPFQLAFGG
ncbi:MAG: prepilin peptidase [Pseudomonadota bacterium]